MLNWKKRGIPNSFPLELVLLMVGFTISASLFVAAWLY